MSTRVTYKLGIDEISPAPSGTGGDLIIDNFKTVADLIENLQTAASCSDTYLVSTELGNCVINYGAFGVVGWYGQIAGEGNIEISITRNSPTTWWLEISTSQALARYAATNLNGCPPTSGWSYIGGDGSYALYSVTDNRQGFSGYSGVSGFSGYSGLGISGFSGYSGAATSGFSGYSGISGYSGRSGYSGIGTSGYSGISGYSGSIGQSGFSGYSGISGQSGVSGYSGLNAPCYSYYEVTVTGNAGAGTFRVGPNGGPVNWYGVGSNGYQIYLDETSSTVWTIVQLQPGDGAFASWTATKTSVCPSTSDSFSLSSGSGSASISAVGVGQNGTSGFSGYSGISGRSGYSGISGYSGRSGYSGVGTSGFSGYSGISGVSGYSGAGGVPTSRNINTTSPLAGGGALSADLTLSMPASSASTAGTMSTTHYSLVNGATANATNNALVKRSSTGTANFNSIDTNQLTSVSDLIVIFNQGSVDGVFYYSDAQYGDAFTIGGHVMAATARFEAQNGFCLRFNGGTPPATATATGAAGDIKWDSNYIYVCTATNTWKRAALSTW